MVMNPCLDLWQLEVQVIEGLRLGALGKVVFVADGSGAAGEKRGVRDRRPGAGEKGDHLVADPPMDRLDPSRIEVYVQTGGEGLPDGNAELVCLLAVDVGVLGAEHGQVELTLGREPELGVNMKNQDQFAETIRDL